MWEWLGSRAQEGVGGGLADLQGEGRARAGREQGWPRLSPPAELQESLCPRSRAIGVLVCCLLGTEAGPQESVFSAL